MKCDKAWPSLMGWASGRKNTTSFFRKLGSFRVANSDRSAISVCPALEKYMENISRRMTNVNARLCQDTTYAHRDTNLPWTPTESWSNWPTQSTALHNDA